MIKLELEELLENGLRQLGVVLRERVYGEDIRTAAKVDDATGDYSVSEQREFVKSSMENLGPEGGLLADMLAYTGLTKSQMDAYRNCFPFFARHSGDYHGCNIEYEVYSTEKLDSYEGQADRLVKEGRIATQFIDIEAKDIGRIANLGVVGGMKGEMETTIFQNISNNYFQARGIKSAERIAALRWLNGREYDPRKLCEGIINFII